MIHIWFFIHFVARGLHSNIKRDRMEVLEMEGSTSLGGNSCLACITRQPGVIFFQDAQKCASKKKVTKLKSLRGAKEK